MLLLQTTMIVHLLKHVINNSMILCHDEKV